MEKENYEGYFPKWMFYLAYIVIASFNVYAFVVGPSDFFGAVLGVTVLLFLAFFAGIIQASK